MNNLWHLVDSLCCASLLYLVPSIYCQSIIITPKGNPEPIEQLFPVPSFPASPWQPSICFLSLWMINSGFPNKWNHAVCDPYDGHLSLSITSLGVICLVACITISYLHIKCIYHILFIHSSMDGHLDCYNFWLLWIVLLWIFMYKDLFKYLCFQFFQIDT